MGPTRRPDFVNAESWQAMDATTRLKLANIAASSRVLETQYHDPARDGPHERMPYPSRQYSHGENDRIPIDPSLQMQGQAGGQYRMRGSGASDSNSRPRPITRSRSRSPSARTSSSAFTDQSARTSRFENLILGVMDTQNKILSQNSDISSRLTLIEQGKENNVVTHPQHGEYSRRGASTRAKRLAGRRGTIEHLVTLPPDDDDTEDLKIPMSGLSDGAKAAKRSLQQKVRSKFRWICGTSESEPWPVSREERFNDETGELYYTPNFAGDATHEDNQKIFAVVADLVSEDLADMNDRPEILQNPKYHWDKSTLVELTKTTFRGFKRDWATQVDAEKAKKKAAHQRANRWTQRRKEKVKRLLSMVPDYIERHGVNPKVVLCEEHMSDEGSGPEDEEVESKDDWKTRMGQEIGITTPAALAKMKFLETIQPKWRSQELSSVFHELYELWWNSLTAKEREGMAFVQIKSTSRTTQVPPMMAPFNFGIDETWWADNGEKGEYRHILLDWYTHGDPDGFGEGGEGENEDDNHDD